MTIPIDTLRGELLELRPLVEADFAPLHAAASDPLIWEQHPEPDRWKADVFRRYFQGAIDSRGAFTALDRASGAVIGSSRFCDHDPATRTIEIGWTFLARRYWGGRYNAEMKRLMLDHAFKHVDRVIFLVGPANLRSQRALKKIGARRTGASHSARGHDSLVYEILK